MKLRFVVYLVTFAAFLAPFSQTIYTPILPEVQNLFQSSTFLVNLTISIYTFCLALMQIVYGPLTDLWGRKKVLLPALALFLVGSVGCLFSNTISLLIFFRAVQAMGIAAGTVVATTVISDLYEGKLRGRALGLFQMMVAIGPVVGPLVGGWVGEHLGYQGIFIILIAVGIVILLLNIVFLKETKPDGGSGDRFQIRDFWLIMKHKIGSSLILISFIQFFSLYHFLVFLPIILSTSYGLSPSEKGFSFTALSLFLVIGTYLSGRFQDRWDPKKSLILFSFLSVVTLVTFIFVAHVSLVLMLINLAFFGLFMGLSQPVQMLMLTNSFTNRRGTAVGIYNVFRFIGMTLGPIVGSYLFQYGELPLLFGVTAVIYLLVLLYASRQFFSRQVQSV
jgi:DHA1 family bicyclomycin/chloramphenicol resistance-like MFS transporter